jgi:uncharacterized LabA/DUF88 family protein
MLAEEELYKSLQKSGFILIFREHSPSMKGKKKGNVDVDIAFELMKNLYENDEVDKMLLLSGDGDYIKIVKHLMRKNKLLKVIFPNRQHSSLYKSIGNQYYYYLYDAKHKISL